MPLATPAILWPVRFAATSYVLRVTYNGVTADCTFGPLTVGRDYWLSYDAQADGVESGDSTTGVGDLTFILAACIASHPSSPTVTVSLNSSQHAVVAVSGLNVCTLLWAHADTTLDPTIFGWVTSTGSFTSHTSPNAVRGWWRPMRAWADDSRDRQPMVGGVSRSVSGRSRVSHFATPRKTRDLTFKWINQVYVLTEYVAATNPYGAFEYAWTHAIALGYPLRLYTDDTAVSTPTYSVYTVRELTDPIARNGDYRIWWDIALMLTKSF